MDDISFENVTKTVCQENQHRNKECCQFRQKGRMKIQNRIVIHGILCALNADFYFYFYSRIVARFRWNLNSKWNRGKPITHWKSIEVRVNKRRKIGNLIFRKIPPSSIVHREKERENLFIHLFQSRKIKTQRNNRILESNENLKSQKTLWQSFIRNRCEITYILA